MKAEQTSNNQKEFSNRLIDTNTVTRINYYGPSTPLICYWPYPKIHARRGDDNEHYLTRKGNVKYPIPANKSTITSSWQSRQAMRIFSERFPQENMHLVASKEYKIPFSR